MDGDDSARAEALLLLEARLRRLKAPSEPKNVERRIVVLVQYDPAMNAHVLECCLITVQASLCS